MKKQIVLQGRGGRLELTYREWIRCRILACMAGVRMKDWDKYNGHEARAFADALTHATSGVPDGEEVAQKVAAFARAGGFKAREVRA